MLGLIYFGETQFFRASQLSYKKILLLKNKHEEEKNYNS